MRTRRSAKKLASIHLTEVRSNSTCHSLKLPLALACDRCESKIDVTLFARKSRKKKRKFSERWSCQQYWDDKWISCMYPTTTRITLYNRIQNYLNTHSNFELRLYTSEKKPLQIHYQILITLKLKN